VKQYSLKKSKKVLIHLYRSFFKKKSATEDQKQTFFSLLETLQNSIVKNSSQEASRLAKKAQEFYSTLPQKSSTKKLFGFLLGLSLALLAAVIIRQTWFELYEIPTGSMRPTFKEQDRVLVSKSSFGINIPLLTKHFYFERDLCKRGSTVVFTSQNLDTPDKDIRYFYLFPGKKQFVKRIIGKPGDTLYFYGGKIYGVDEHGNDISYLLQDIKNLGDLEHIPFIRFEGSMSGKKNTIKQMGQEIIRFERYLGFSSAPGKILDTPITHNLTPRRDYYDLWGFKNYSMARLVYPNQLDITEKKQLGDLSNSPFFLELHHSPSVTHSRGLNKSVSYIPLNENHLKLMFENLYTSRFIVKNESVYRYGDPKDQSNVSLKNIPDGTYEFYHGVAYQIFPTGISKALPNSHPLYTFSYEALYLLFNIGIEWNSFYLPKTKEDPYLPARYAYFRDGNLHLLGKPILSPNDLELINFLNLERKKEELVPFYKAFIDHGPPKGKDFILSFGLKIPPNHYLMLGDNHAMSGDSREFGFVPEENIKGRPVLIFYPFGGRWGALLQPITPWSSLSNLLVWTLGLLSLLIGSYFSNRKHKFPINF
jgi:signal peptidase I